jgi:hypothetical protein
MRLRVQRLLRAATLEPAGLPPAAVLVVRSLADPLPGRLAPRPDDVRAPAEWEGAVRAALADRWRGAARPGRGPVPAGANAVLFADTAEMIAAFARDACAGDVGQWWWKALMKELPGAPVAALTALWTREARHVPAALEHLAGTGDADRVAAALPPAQAARILAAVALAFEAPALLAAPPPAPLPGAAHPSFRASGDDHGAPSVPTPAPPRVDGLPGRADGLPARAATPLERPRGVHSSTPAAWAGLLPADAVPRGLAPEQEALVGLGLVLHRAPLVARGTPFVARFVRWRADAAGRPSPADRRSDSDPSTGTGVDLSVPRAPIPPWTSLAEPESASGTEAARRAADRDDRTHGADPLAIDPPPSTAAAQQEREGGRAIPEPAAHHHPRPSASLDEADEAADTTDRPPAHIVVKVVNSTPPRGTDETPLAAQDAEPWEVRIFSPPVEEARVASGACGVFFLVNVLRSMDFFRLLDEHFGVAPVVGGWGWVELAARALLGPDAAGLADDPLWRLLAEVDGRDPEELPGAGFPPVSIDRLPDAWIELFGGAPPSPEPSPLLGMEGPVELRRFLDVIIPVVRARIGAALRAVGADPDEGLETALFRREGTVDATRTHVDVHMAVDQVTLPVRLAGLDANPGWVPELARVVTFYFA